MKLSFRILAGFFCLAVSMACQPDAPAPKSGCTASYRAAGVLPYAEHQGDIWLLLGYEDGRGWTDFVGSRDAGECDAAKTAAREFAEESRQAFPAPAYIKKMNGTEPVVVKSSNGPVHIWPLLVPWMDLMAMQILPETKNSEKLNYCWVPAGKLLEAIDRQAEAAQVPETCGGEVRTLYKPFRKNLEVGNAMRLRLEKLVEN